MYVCVYVNISILSPSVPINPLTHIPFYPSHSSYPFNSFNLTPIPPPHLRMYVRVYASMCVWCRYYFDEFQTNVRKGDPPRRPQLLNLYVIR